MQHELTDAQILYAADDATEETTSSYKAVGLPYLRAFLNSLPDQPGDDALREQAGLYKDLLDHPFFKDWSISGTSIRSFMMNKLDSAMTPQDDWQECTFDEIRKGDRVREVVDQGNGTFETTEGIASVVTESNHSDGRSWRTADRIYELACDDYALDYHKVTLYRIPKPVVHPDPAEHPVIIDEMGEPWFWVGLDGDYHSHTRPSTFRSPSDFTFWTPAKVVSADE